MADVLSQRGRFSALMDDHPSIGATCPLCGQPMQVGDVPALIGAEPASAEDAVKAADGRAYTAIAQMVHERCVYPDA